MTNFDHSEYAAIWIISGLIAKWEHKGHNRNNIGRNYGFTGAIVRRILYICYLLKEIIYLGTY